MLKALLAATAAGCAPRRDTGAGRPGRKTVVRFWNGFTGPDGKTMEAMVRRFEAENPDVAVSMQIIPWATYYDKVTLSLAFGGAPDLFVTHASRLPEFAEYGVVRPLADLWNADPKPLTEADFAPVPWKASFYKGTQYALPLDVHPIGLYYNRDLFDRAGIAKPPETWDDFLQAAKEMTRDTDGDGRPDEWGFVFTWQHSNFLTFAPQFGGGILTPDGTRSAMDSPQTLAAAHAMTDIIYKHGVAPRPEGVDAWLAFRQGKVAMALEGVYMLSSLQEQKGLHFAGAPTPQFGPTPACWGGSHMFVQPNDSDPRQKRPPEQSRAAWRLMRYLSDNSLLWAEGGQVPARVAVRDSAAFQALPVQSAFAKQLPYVVYEPLTPKANAIAPFVDPSIESFLLRLQTPEAALSDASRRINQVLERP